MACKDMVRVKSGPYAGTVSYGHLTPPFPGDGDVLGRSVKYISELNRHGLCLFDFSALFYLVIFLQEQGILSEKQVGFRVKDDDLGAALKLIEMTVQRKGFGEVLAEGLPGMARLVPGAEKYVVHIKGRSPVFEHGRGFDPRVKGLGTMEFTMVTNPRVSHVSTGGSPAYGHGRPPSDFARHGERMGIPTPAIPRVAPETGFNPGRFTRYSEDWCALFDCLGLCNRAFVNRFYHVNSITDLYNAITGREQEPAQMMKVAERTWNLWRLLNVKAGFSRKDDVPPPVWFTPLKAGGKELVLHDYYETRTLTPQDVQQLLDEYYDERGWDRTTGAPTPQKLRELGLEKFAARR